MAVKRLERFNCLLDLEEEEDEDFFELFVSVYHLLSKKRKHRFWIHPIVLKRKQHGSFHHLVQELRLHGAKFQEYFRMTVTQFEDLLAKVGESLQKTTRSRETISPTQRLAICLR